MQAKASELRGKVAAASQKVNDQCNCGYKCELDLGANLIELGAGEELTEEERATFDVSFEHFMLIESEHHMRELEEMSVEELAEAGICTLSPLFVFIHFESIE